MLAIFHHSRSAGLRPYALREWRKFDSCENGTKNVNVVFDPVGPLLSIFDLFGVHLVKEQCNKW